LYRKTLPPRFVVRVQQNLLLPYKTALAPILFPGSLGAWLSACSRVSARLRGPTNYPDPGPPQKLLAREYFRRLSV